MIPLIEWYRANPDDLFLLEVSMGAIAGQMCNIDEDGATSMMFHVLPHVMAFDPHSGDYGLGFFGHSLESGAYWVQDRVRGHSLASWSQRHGPPETWARVGPAVGHPGTVAARSTWSSVCKAQFQPLAATGGA